MVFQYPLATISVCLLGYLSISGALDKNPRQLAQKGILPLIALSNSIAASTPDFNPKRTPLCPFCSFLLLLNFAQIAKVEAFG